MLDLLVALQARLRLALLFISHDLGVIQHVSHRIAVMDAGRIIETRNRGRSVRQSTASLYQAFARRGSAFAGMLMSSTKPMFR